MPIFEYKCTNGRCANLSGFEYLHVRSGGDKLTACPECGFPVENLMSAFSPRFTGSGFYSTDYKNGNKPKKVEVSGKTETITDPKEIRKLKKESKGGTEK